MLQVGRTAVAGADLGSLLSSVCAALPATLGVSGAAIVLVDQPDRPAGLAGVSASDAASGRLGEMELRAGTGPVSGAVRSGRPMVTPDLTRIGPPELAAAAADTGLTCSVVVPLLVDGEPVGGLQLFGHPGRPVGDGHVDAVTGLADVLSARLSDVCALRRLTATVARLTAEQEAALPVAHATGMLAERYRTDVEEAGRYLASRAGKAGVEPAEAARAVLDRTDAPPVPGEDTPTQVFGAVTPGRGADGWPPSAALPAGAVPTQRRGPAEERSRSTGGRRRLAEDHPATPGRQGVEPVDLQAGRRPDGPERPQADAERSRGSRSEARAPQVEDARDPRRQPWGPERRAARGPVAPAALPPTGAAGPSSVPSAAPPAAPPAGSAAGSSGVPSGGPSGAPQPPRGAVPAPDGRPGHGETRPPAPPSGGRRRLREPAAEVLPGRDPWDLDQAALPGPGAPARSGGRRRAEDRPDAPRVPQQRRDGQAGDERTGRRAEDPAAAPVPGSGAPPVPGPGAPRARHRRADII
ncbi:GAF domain-containing protein [Pseudonocardia kujensis]|uniref:GAF domain-containing protein n=1 Tax=Pseudonocardia kujensis TaxID=1128675 RepID=UPI001E383A50|nr:GAF domain-containing protein [Pseudonocardia kujensis]MCE0766805.1 GAF domain-containing protein [Pseudonocardia kujensis]